MRVKTLMSSRAGRAVSQLAGLLGPAAQSALVWPFGPLLSIPQPAAASPPVPSNWSKKKAPKAIAFGAFSLNINSS